MDAKTKIRKFLMLFLTISSFLLATGCESRILPGLIGEAVDINTPEYSLSVEKTGNGTINIQSAIVKGSAETAISAGPDADWVFSHWSVTAGSGVIFGNPDDRDTTVILTSGDAVICANFVPDQYLRLTTPDGGESFLLTDNAVEIRWDSLNLSGNIEIYLCDGNGTTVAFLASPTVGSGLFTWNVAADNQSAGAYRIRIALSSDSSFSDISESIFYLSNLSVGGPNSGAFGMGGSCPITWTSDISTGNLKIELMSGSTSTVVRTITDNVPVSNGSYSWTPTNPTYSGGVYSIRLTNTDNANIQAQSGTFSLIDGIDVTSPGTTSRTAGSSLPISWSCPTGGNVKIELLESGSLITTITSSTANDGSHSYTIPASQLPDTRYAVRVTTSTTPAYSDTSSEFYILPPTPTGVSASDAVYSTRVNVSWSGVSGNPSYKIYRDTSSTGAFSTNLGTVTGSNSYSDTTATPGTRYYYKVSALRNGVEGAKSGWNDGVRDIIAPIITSTHGYSSQIYIDWTDVTGRQEYRIYRSTSSSSGYTKIATVSSSYYYDTTANPGQRYYYKIGSYNSLTGEKLSDSANNFRPLAKPTGLTGDNANTGYLTLSWTAVSGSVSGYKLYRNEYSETTGVWAGWQLLATTGTSYTYPPPVAGKQYRYYVKAYNSVTGESLQSDEIYAYSKIWAPTEFTAVTGGISSNNLSWYGETAATGGYEIQAYHFATLWKTQTIVSQTTYTYIDSFPTNTRPTSYRIRSIYDSLFVGYDTYSDWETISAP